MENRYVDILISQLIKRSGNQQEPMIKSGNKVIINPIDDSGNNYCASIIISNISYLNLLLERYILTVRKSTIKFCEFNNKYGIKYYLSNIWNNATNCDLANPYTFIRRYISFIEDRTFEYIDDVTCIGSVGTINGIDSNIYVRRCQCERGYETPFEMSFYIGSINNPNTLYCFPKIRYGIEDIDGVKVAYIYAIESNSLPVVTEYDKAVDCYFRKINQSISGMKNRGVHTPVFLVSITLFLGMLSTEGVQNLLIADMLMGRRKNKNRFNKMDEEQLDKLQYNLTEKLLQTMWRMSTEFKNMEVLSMPNDIDSFMHLYLEKFLETDNFLLGEIYKIGSNAGQFQNNR